METLSHSNANPPEPLHFKTDRRSSQRTSPTVRRYSERLYGSCQAIVRGVDSEGKEFTEVTMLENVSASGLYVKIPRRMKAGSHLFVVFAFSTVALQEIQAPRVAVRGQICRIDALNEDVTGVGLRFQRHRFL